MMSQSENARPEVDTNNGQATWCRIVFDRPYNKHSNAALRIRGWDDPHLEKRFKPRADAARPIPNGAGAG
jgi:hypothetical protein